jgi:hypothetical protein
MIRKLSTSDPYSSLCRDLYSVGIFDRTINGILSVIEKNDKHRTILIERQFLNTSGSQATAGYCLVQCLESPCEEDHLRWFRGLLEKIVKQRAKGNYMEVDPILVAAGFTPVVLGFVEQYNRIQRRKPIQLFVYGE